MVGKKTLPDTIKKARGTDQPCRMNPDAPIFDQVIKVPPAPKWFTKLGKQIWRDTCRELVAKGLLESIGIPILVSYCNSMANYLEAEEKMFTEGRTVEEWNKFGSRTKVSPWQKISTDELAKALSIAQQYGITPSARAKVKGINQTKDPHADMFD